MAKYGAGVHSVYDMPHDQEISRHGIAPGRTVTEDRRETPVIRDVDVIVVGGGPGGVAAATAAVLLFASSTAYARRCLASS